MDDINIQKLIDLYHEKDKNEIIERLATKDKEQVITYLKGYEQFQNKNYKEALSLFEECNCSYYLGLIYLYGLTGKTKEKKAFKLLQEELDNKVNPHLGLMLLYGIGCTKDIQKAYDLVIDEANKNDLKSMLVLYKYYEIINDESKINELTTKILNSNDFSIDFATNFNEIYLDILLKNHQDDKIKLLVMNAIDNDDIEIYENVISYYYDNEQYQEIIKIYKKKIKCNRSTLTKIKNTKRMVKAQKIDQSINSIKEAKIILRIYNIKMLYLGTGFACYIIFIGLYFLYYLMYKANVNNYSIYLILGSLFVLSSIVTLFFSTRIMIKEKLDLPTTIVIFNQISSIILILIATIISYAKFNTLIPFKTIPIIVIIIVHILFTLLAIFLSLKNKKLKNK